MATLSQVKVILMAKAQEYRILVAAIYLTQPKKTMSILRNIMRE